MAMSLSLAAGRQLVESFPFMTDWGNEGVRRGRTSQKPATWWTVKQAMTRAPSVMPIAQPGSAH